MKNNLVSSWFCPSPEVFPVPQPIMLNPSRHKDAAAADDVALRHCCSARMIKMLVLG
jgi:hypothetical protein